MNGWSPNPCVDAAGWTGVTVCRRPYGIGAYGAGPYGRCAVIGGSLWSAALACAPFSAQAPAPSPFRRAARG